IFFAYSFLFFCSFLFTVPAHLDFSTLSLHDALPISYGVGALFAGLWHTTIPQFAPHVALGWSMYMVLNSVINESTQVLYRARSFIMDGRMRLTDFVLRSMAKALFHFGMSIPILVLTLGFYPDVHPA